MATARQAEGARRGCGPPWLGQAQFWFACLFAAGWTGVVCGGLAVQFGSWEYPCPLCMVQRMFMLLAALGALHVVRAGMRGTIGGRDYMTGWGLALVACMAGAFTSWRQTMLHILPGDAGYGAPVLGLHLYVWAWILFMAAVAAIGILLAFAPWTAAPGLPAPVCRRAGQLVFAFVALVTAVNLVAVFLLEGFHWFLPDDPGRYQFFYDLKILKK
ncbi:disulfide bond formation protein B [Streptomyces sp. Je 1-369]|uniref:disulfide bond formation protein B n=1 Tax=Streptomyces sp. Je 1-369 TaxID=2966192 RepID=UPI0022869BFC|nr:disulfide bond formation protein B [Streptomyces sp. Je 1-369]WAL93090.1 disulfide bond formation protein B [Streptomyces sp. Je 1-369]WAL99890.1 disulfide bond formation protein B [Streptomyces sp. Je 1-369]